MATIHYTAIVKADRLLELPDEASELHLEPGQQVQIQLESPDKIISQPKPNEKMLAVLSLIEERHQDRPYTNGADTLRLIHEARGGAMYGDEPVE